MKALKGLMIYVGIVLGMLVGVCVLLFSIMYFVPSFRIMGVGVIHKNQNSPETIIKLEEFDTFEKIDLSVNSKRIEINCEIVNGLTDIKYDFDLNSFGIAFDIVEYGILQDAKVEDKTLKLNLSVTEPTGWISDTSSVLKITIPAQYKYDLAFKTTDGNIDLKSYSDSATINKLTVTTGKGHFNADQLGEKIGDKYYLILNSLNLTTESGNFDLTRINELTINEPIKLFSSNGDFFFNNVNASFNVAGSGVKVGANTINAGVDGFKFISENGFFEINKLVTPTGAENTIIAENCDIKINEVFGKTAIVSTYGNIKIETINGPTMLETEHGNVQITLAKDDIRVQTDMGNIDVNSYLRNGKFVSRKGNISVVSNGEYEDGIYTQIENEDGQINVDNKVNKLLVKTTGTSKVEITFREIKGGLDKVFQHMINIGAYSSAIVYMPTTNYKTPFKFRASGNISGEISGLTNEYEGDEVISSDEYQIYPSSAAQEAAQSSCYFDFIGGTIEFRGYLNK